MARNLIAVGLLFGLAALAQSSASARPAVAHAAACAAGETTIYSCPLAHAQVAVCTTASRVTLRYAPAAGAAVVIASNGHDGRAHGADIPGTGGGDQTHLRFTQRGADYVVWVQEGEAARNTGVRRSGVTLQRGGRTVSTQVCPDVARATEYNTPSFVDAEPGAEFHTWY
jgi:hypothetical protein